MPLTVGGGVRTVEDVRALLLAGADKVSINTAAVNDRGFVARGGGEIRRPVHRRRHRRQARVAGRRAPAAGRSSPMAGATPTGLDAVDFAQRSGGARRRRDPRSPPWTATAPGGLRPRADPRHRRRRAGAGDRLGRRRHARPPRRRRARRPRQRGARRLDLPLRRAFDRRGQGAHGRARVPVRLDCGLDVDDRPSPSPTSTRIDRRERARGFADRKSYTAKLIAAGRRARPRSSARRRSRRRSPPCRATATRSMAEAADVLYHLLVRAQAGGVAAATMSMAELERRTAQTRPRRESGARRMTCAQRWPDGPRTQSRRRPSDDLSPYRVFTRDEWARLRADTPMTLTADDVARLQSLNDPISLDEVIAIYLPLSRLLVALCRGDAGPVQGDPALPRRERRQGALHHRHRRLGGGRQIDHRARAAGAAGALAEHAEGRPRHHRRLPAAERRAEARRA